MLHLPIRFGSTSFQSNEVSGVQNSKFLLLFNTQSGSIEWLRRSQRQMKSSEEARRLGLGFEGEDDDDVAIGWNMSFVGGYGWSKEREGWRGLRERESPGRS